MSSTINLKYKFNFFITLRFINKIQFKIKINIFLNNNKYFKFYVQFQLENFIITMSALSFKISYTLFKVISYFFTAYSLYKNIIHNI